MIEDVFIDLYTFQYISFKMETKILYNNLPIMYSLLLLHPSTTQYCSSSDDKLCSGIGMMRAHKYPAKGLLNITFPIKSTLSLVVPPKRNNAGPTL